MAKHSKSKQASKLSKRSKVAKASKRSKKSRTSPSKHEAYCVRCHKTVKMTGCKLAKASNGRLMFQGKCGVCGAKVNRFVKNGTKSC
jgi:hypothetical protein